jgi:hypothetical protein
VRKAVSDFDVPQNFTMSGTWELPNPAFRWSPLTTLTNGWQLGSVVQLTSGLPFTPIIAGDPLGLRSSIRYAFPDRLNAPGCDNPVNPGNPSSYIKLSCFAPPNPSTRLGDAGRNVARAPGLIGWDASLFKNLRITRVSEDFKIQLRFEAFNVLNHTNFLPPAGSSLQLFTQNLVSIPSAGNITATSTTSRQIQAAVKVMW